MKRELRLCVCLVRPPRRWIIEFVKLAVKMEIKGHTLSFLHRGPLPLEMSKVGGIHVCLS